MALTQTPATVPAPIADRIFDAIRGTEWDALEAPADVQTDGSQRLRLDWVVDSNPDGESDNPEDGEYEVTVTVSVKRNHRGWAPPPAI